MLGRFWLWQTCNSNFVSARKADRDSEILRRAKFRISHIQGFLGWPTGPPPSVRDCNHYLGWIRSWKSYFFSLVVLCRSPFNKTLVLDIPWFCFVHGLLQKCCSPRGNEWVGNTYKTREGNLDRSDHRTEMISFECSGSEASLFRMPA